MSHWIVKLMALGLLVIGGGAALYVFQFRDTTAVQLRESERRVEQLRNIAPRLNVERRVADIIVIDQQPATQPSTRPTTAPTTAPSAPVTGAGDAPSVRTTLLFVEYDSEGNPLPAKRFTIDGNVAHLNAMVLKFDGKFLEQHNPLRGHSIALFTRVYGENQAPENGQPIDEPGEIPEIYRGRDPKVSEFEQDLWQNFWRLAEDEAHRKEMGVRIAQGEGVSTRFLPDRLYTVTLEADGRLNVASQPLEGIYSDALRQRVSS